MSRKQNLTKRQLYNLSFFYPKYFEEDQAVDIIERISELGSRTGFIGNQGDDTRREHKYDTWIAKIVKDALKGLEKRNAPLNVDILDKELEFQSILDWMIEEKVDAFKYTFDEAFQAQDIWHQKIAMNMQIEKIDNPDLEPERIVYRCQNQEYFFYILDPRELKYEGTHMGHCVGGVGYQNKVKNDNSIIVSLRDKNNNPHVTTEILLRKDGGVSINGIVAQCQGKMNEGTRKPKPKYLEMIQEFVLFASDFYSDETMSFMNKHYF
jgi:hypothetical protein